MPTLTLHLFTYNKKYFAYTITAINYINILMIQTPVKGHFSVFVYFKPFKYLHNLLA